MISSGWEGAEHLLRSEVEDLREAVSILEVAEALGVQIHPYGLTCPDPDHHQTGRDAPARTFIASSGDEMWWCYVCDEGGDLFTYVLASGHAADFTEALDVVAEIAEGWSSEERPARQLRRAPEDPAAKIPVRTKQGRAECEAYLSTRGWEMIELLGRDRWAFVCGDGYWLRVYTADRSWWQERAISGQRKPDGTPWRWRSPYEHESRLLVWEPDYVEARRRVRVTDFKRMTKGTVIEEIDHHPAVMPRVLVVEGPSDWITAVVAQSTLPLRRRFPVVALPGVGSYRKLDFRSDWTVLVDNDEAGRRCRDEIDADQEDPVRHLLVPEPFGDLSDWWAAQPDIGSRIRWVDQLRNALEP